MRDRKATPDDTAAKVDRAYRLWGDGKRRGALESLKAAIREDPNALELRRALAGLYRDLGCPDQAGRWGIAIEGWTSSLERDRLARLLVASGVASRDVADFLAVPMPTENFAELDALMAGPVQAYRERFTFEERERQRNDERSDFVGDIAENAWITTMVASVLGVAAVFVNTVLGLGDASGFARFIGLVLGAMVGLSVFANSAGAAAERRWGRAAALGVVAVLVTTGSIFGLMALLFA